MSEPEVPTLTLAEAVPLGTVLLQRLLVDAEVRGLAIKGPAFVELGVRRPKQSNDIDLLLHPDDRARATAALVDAGWVSISHWFPPAMDDVIYSTTFRHPRFPATVDVHHALSGVFAWPRGFESMWTERTQVLIAHRTVTTTSPAHALVIEALNQTKSAPRETWRNIVEQVLSGASAAESTDIATAAASVGARHSAAPLIQALGGPEPDTEPPEGYAQWARECGGFRTRLILWHFIRRSPSSLPKMMWRQITLREDIARCWADAHGVRYRSRAQILRLRIWRLIRGRSWSGS